MVTRGGFSEALPVIALFGFVGVRLMHAFKSLYSDATKLRFAEAALDALSDDLKNTLVSDHEAEQGAGGRREQLRLQNRLFLDNVCYSYPAAAHPTPPQPEP